MLTFVDRHFSVWAPSCVGAGLEDGHRTGKGEGSAGTFQGPQLTGTCSSSGSSSSSLAATPLPDAQQSPSRASSALEHRLLESLERLEGRLADVACRPTQKQQSQECHAQQAPLQGREQAAAAAAPHAASAVAGCVESAQHAAGGTQVVGCQQEALVARHAALPPPTKLCQQPLQLLPSLSASSQQPGQALPLQPASSRQPLQVLLPPPAAGDAASSQQPLRVVPLLPPPEQQPLRWHLQRRRSLSAALEAADEARPATMAAPPKEIALSGQPRCGGGATGAAVVARAGAGPAPGIGWATVSKAEVPSAGLPVSAHNVSSPLSASPVARPGAPPGSDRQAFLPPLRGHQHWADSRQAAGYTPQAAQGPASLPAAARAEASPSSMVQPLHAGAGAAQPYWWPQQQQQERQQQQPPPQQPWLGWQQVAAAWQHQPAAGWQQQAAFSGWQHHGQQLQVPRQAAQWGYSAGWVQPSPYAALGAGWQYTT